MQSSNVFIKKKKTSGKIIIVSNLRQLPESSQWSQFRKDVYTVMNTASFSWTLTMITPEPEIWMNICGGENESFLSLCADP